MAGVAVVGTVDTWDIAGMPKNDMMLKAIARPRRVKEARMVKFSLVDWTVDRFGSFDPAKTAYLNARHRAPLTATIDAATRQRR
jgi:hypothetical protein